MGLIVWPAGGAQPQLLWLTSPVVFGDSQPHNAYMTTARAAAMSAYAETAMRKLGLPVVDAWSMTLSRWDAYGDGVSVAAESDVSWMVDQVVLNALFPTCTGAGTVPAK